MSEVLSSSFFTLSLAMGAVASIGLLHLALWRRGQGGETHLWVAVFCAASLFFLTAGLLETRSVDVAEAVRAGRLQASAAPWLIYALVGFATSLRERAGARNLLRGVFALCTVLSVLGGTTSLMISAQTSIDSDCFGHAHVSARGTAGLVLGLLYAAPAYGYVVYEVVNARGWPEAGRRAVLASMAIHAGIGLLSVLRAMDVVAFPHVGEYGPLIVAAGLSHLLVQQHAQLRARLEAATVTRTDQLEASEARYRELVENAPLGILASDHEGRLTTINSHLCAMLGIDPEVEGTGVRVYDLPVLAKAGIGELAHRCLTLGRPQAGEFVVDLPSGQAELGLEMAAIRAADGSIVGTQAIVKDVGRRRGIDARLRHSQKMEAVGALAAGIVHEINNPMAYVRANLCLLRDEWRGLEDDLAKELPGAPMLARMGECEELIDDSLEGVDRAVSIVRAVREFSQGRSDDWSSVDLAEVLEDALRSASHERRGSVALDQAIEDLPGVMGSATQLRQVFVNLITNALHAVGDAGRVRVEARADGLEAVVAVVDDGCGITPEVRDQLFDPFFTTKPAGTGTGLGLYICYEIVRYHGGAIRVETEPGAGSRFEVRLPSRAD